jgi:hypothetical protein
LKSDLYEELISLNPNDSTIKRQLSDYRARLADKRRAEEQRKKKEAARQTACKPDLFDGYVMAQVFVERQLKSPRTAKFAGYDESRVISTGSCGEVYIQSFVDSQNGFGAMIRTHYEIAIKYEGDEKWSLLDLNVTR